MTEINIKDIKLDEIFCISECIKWIKENKFSNVAVQIPFENRDSCVHIHTELRNGAQCSIIEILKRLNSCCPRSLDALKVKAEAIIHFGDTCLTPTHLLPVLYVLAPSPTTDVEKVHECVLGMDIPTSERLIFVYDSCNINVSEKIYCLLKHTFDNLIKSNLEIPENGYLVYEKSCIESRTENNITGKMSFDGRTAKLAEGCSISEYNFIYYGSSANTLSVLQHRFSQSTFYHVDNSCNTKVIKDSVKLIMCRSCKIELIKEANWMGVIWGTTAVTGTSEMAIRMRKMIESSGKRSTTILMLDLNENKLANFKCDLFVYLNCPQSTLFDRLEQRYIYQKLVTTWEVESALNPNFQWSLNFELNFSEFLAGKRLYTELPITPSDATENGECVKGLKLLCIRNNGTVSLPGSNDLQSHSWNGLDPKGTPMTSLNEIVKGRKGIAIAYENEGDSS